MGIMDLLSKKKKQDKKEPKKKKTEPSENNPLIFGKPNVQPKDGKDRFWVIMESMTGGMEKHYFMVLRLMREKPSHGIGCDDVKKVRDVFDASVTSSFHGHVGTKISAMQQQASQHLATLGSMVKTIFPIVRELRVMDERLEYYEKSKEGDESAEVALKSTWIEVVEQGMQNPNSVYSLSTKVGYLTLPDLFFRINPKDELDGVDAAIKSLVKEGVPNRVGDVCAKKLFQYYNWKHKTYKEMQHTRKFRLKYLKQHYHVIRMYMNWVRPYLQSISQLQMRGDSTDADLVGAFESAKIEVELLGTYKGFEHYKPVIHVKFNFVSRPDMMYTPQGQKQPVHAGRTEMHITPYVLTQDQIDEYVAHKDREDMEILSSLDQTMEAIKEDLHKYLKEAGEEFDEEKEDKKKQQDTVWGLFKPLGGGMKELFGAFGGLKMGPSVSKKTARARQKEFLDAKGKAAGMSRLLYYVYKKATKLYTEI